MEASQGTSEQSEQAHKALALDVCPGSPSTHLLQLPQDLLGLIYAAIKEGQKRRAFFHCCKATRTAQSIICQISSLQVDAETQDLACVCFPKGACMRSLTLGHASRTMSSRAFSRLLLALQNPNLHTSALCTVSSLSLKELPLVVSAEDSALLGAACARMEHLVSLELDAAPVLATFFQELLQSLRARHQLHRLHIRSVTRSVPPSSGMAILPYLSQFHGLQVLNFQLKSLPMLDVSHLASLTNLRELDLLPKSAPWNVGGLHDILQSCTQLWKLKVPVLSRSLEPQTLSSSSLRVLVLESIDMEELPLLFQAFSLQELSIKSSLTASIPCRQEEAAELAAQLDHAVRCSGCSIDSLKGMLGVPLPEGAAPSRPGDHSFCLEGSVAGSQDARLLAQCVAPLAGTPLMRSLRRMMMQSLVFNPGAMSDLADVFPDVEELEIGASNLLSKFSFAEAVSDFWRLREITLGVDFSDNNVEGDAEELKRRVIDACCEAQNLSRELVFTLAVHSGMGSLHRLVLFYNKAMDIANGWYRMAAAQYPPPITAHVKILKTDYGDLF